MIDLSKNLRLAEKMNTLAYEYERFASSVSAIANKSSSYWNGEANEALIEEIKEWQREAMSIYREMEDLGRKIKIATLIVYEEERQKD